MESMATSSFDKHFTLDSERALESFSAFLSEKPSPITVDRSKTSPEAMHRAEEKLMHIMSHRSR
jgi:hypothetical protein